jgi:hypothetical protein
MRSQQDDLLWLELHADAMTDFLNGSQGRHDGGCKSKGMRPGPNFRRLTAARAVDGKTVSRHVYSVQDSI